MLKRILFLSLCSFALCASCGGGQSVTPDEPEQEKGTPIVYLDMTRWNRISASETSDLTGMWEAMHLVSTLQGIVNRDEPRLYIDYVVTSGKDVDRFWWDQCIGDGKWLPGCEVTRLSDPVKAVEAFKDQIQGMVVYDPQIASTSNVASTVAGVEDLVAVRYDPSTGSIYSRLLKAGIPVKVWLLNEDGTSKFHSKLEPYRWAIDQYLKTGKCSGAYAAYYIDQFWLGCAGKATLNHHQLCNHDFFVSQKAFFFDLSPWGDEVATDAPSDASGADCALLQELLREWNRLNGGQRFCHIGGFAPWAYKYTNASGVGGKHDPVLTEWEFARIISAYNAFMDADALSYGAMANASFWQHYPLKETYPQSWTTRDALKAKGWIGADGKVDRSRKYVLFYVGDYDSSAWLYQMMPTLWEDKARGTLPLMWSINPTLARRAPMVMDYLRATAKEGDYFAAGDNGAGYLNPGMLEAPRPLSALPSGIAAWAQHSEPFYRQWGLKVTGFIIDGSGPGMSEAGFKSYAAFSPGGIVPLKTPSQAALYDGMPMMRSGLVEVSETNAEAAAATVLSDLDTAHPEFPFYWYRSILKSPTWHANVKKALERKNSHVAWLSGPEFFELLRCYLEEGQTL
ncbi:MAG: hypothetical protein IJ654_03175 [Bacteroidales bacterium]|nr:hypothetical protein [Bacteroidales bacterium]